MPYQIPNFSFTTRVLKHADFIIMVIFSLVLYLKISSSALLHLTLKLKERNLAQLAQRVFHSELHTDNIIHSHGSSTENLHLMRRDKRGTHIKELFIISPKTCPEFINLEPHPKRHVTFL